MITKLTFTEVELLAEIVDGAQKDTEWMRSSSVSGKRNFHRYKALLSLDTKLSEWAAVMGRQSWGGSHGAAVMGRATLASIDVEMLPYKKVRK